MSRKTDKLEGTLLRMPISSYLKQTSKTRVKNGSIFFYIEEVPHNMYCSSSFIEYIIMEVSQNITIYTYSVTLAYNGISIITYLKTPALECIFVET